MERRIVIFLSLLCSVWCQAPNYCNNNANDGNCDPDQQLTRYFYNAAAGSCDTFQYTGCGGNRNNFQSYLGCICTCEPTGTECATTYGDATGCQEPRDGGLCGLAEEAWYYDTNTGECTLFYYTGCGGNGNRYSSEAECEGFCETSNCPVCPACQNGLVQTTNVDANGCQLCDCVCPTCTACGAGTTQTTQTDPANNCQLCTCCTDCAACGAGMVPSGNTDANGCPDCACVPATVCPSSQCPYYCYNKQYYRDSNNCPRCRCLSGCPSIQYPTSCSSSYWEYYRDSWDCQKCRCRTSSSTLCGNTYCHFGYRCVRVRVCTWYGYCYYQYQCRR